jgi:two-component system response regulator YesN
MINTEYRGMAIEERDGLVISFEDEDGEANLLKAGSLCVCLA